jgi:hypothetical protein
MTMTTPSLGTIARKVSFGSTGRFTKQRLRGKTDERAEAMKWKRLLRWALQAEARALLPNERVAECLRKLNPIAGNVEVLHNAEHQVAHYKSLVVCGSVWLCPLCAAKISERRRDELIQAITAHITQQGAVYMATYTISHTRFDDLPDLLRTFLRARKRLKQGEYAQRRKGSFGVVGTISVLETTWSLLNHWHPHIHELIFTVAQQDERGVSAYEAVSRMAWKQAAERERLHMNEHGYRLDRTFGAVADYIAKFGREPPCTPWGVEAEMTKGHLKHGRGPVEHLTPFGVLYQVYLGQEELIPVFKEYARCFKGRHQLTWSSGLRRRLLGDGREKTDEELAAEEREEAVLLGRLTRRQWRVVLANDVRGELLEVAHRGDWQRVIAFLASIGSDITEEEPAYAV